MSNTPSKAEIEALVKRHGATSYRNRADTQHPAYGFTEDGLNGLIDEVLAKWGTPQQEAQGPAVDGFTRWFTVVYKDISPGDEARLLGEHPKASAMSWSHAIQDRDAALAAQGGKV